VGLGFGSWSGSNLKRMFPHKITSVNCFKFYQIFYMLLVETLRWTIKAIFWQMVIKGQLKRLTSPFCLFEEKNRLFQFRKFFSAKYPYGTPKQ
jgi:hypothetical protein